MTDATTQQNLVLCTIENIEVAVVVTVSDCCICAELRHNTAQLDYRSRIQNIYINITIVITICNLYIIDAICAQTAAITEQSSEVNIECILSCGWSYTLATLVTIDYITLVCTVCNPKYCACNILVLDTCNECSNNTVCSTLDTCREVNLALVVAVVNLGSCATECEQARCEDTVNRAINCD